MFEHWKAYWKMQRWGEEWMQTAQLTAAELKTGKPLSEFMPKYTPPPKDDDPQAINDRSVAIANQFLKAYNARFSSGRN